MLSTHEQAQTQGVFWWGIIFAIALGWVSSVANAPARWAKELITKLSVLPF